MINTKLNKSDFLLLVIYFVIFILVESFDHTFHFNQINYTFINPDGSSYSQVNTSPSLEGYLIGVPISFICTVAILLSFFKWLIPKYLIDEKKYLIFVFFGTLVLIFYGVLKFTIWHWAEHAPWQTYPSIVDLVIKGLSNSASNAGLPLGILLTKKYFEAQVQMADIQKKQKESELKLLQAQINPHFLFNNLNTLDALIDSRPEQAKKYIKHLSALYRYLISTKDKEVVPLKEELSMIRNYFYLIETRFGDIYTFTIDGENDTEDKYLPVGALQVLIENVVKHNRILNGNPIKTTLTIDDQQIVVINNKGEIAQKRESFGTGLNNLKERYALLFDKEINISNHELQFKVCIPLIELVS